MDTTRKYPRSLSDAFPDVRAASVEIHRPASSPLGWKVSMWMCGFAFASLIVMHVVGWLV